MRSEFKPNLEYIEKMFPKINELTKKGIKIVLDTTGHDIDFFSENRLQRKMDIAIENMESEAFKNIEYELEIMINKNMAKYHNINIWFTPDSEYVAFKICLTDPIKVNNFTKNELSEIVTKIWKRNFLEKEQMNYYVSKFGCNLIYYYKELLKINFENYKPEYFEYEKGHFFDDNREEIVNKIWNQ